MAHENWPWLALIALGAYHGLNPAMGWLFAVALGLQEGRREAVVKAFWPIALGTPPPSPSWWRRCLALQVVVPLEVLRYLAAGSAHLLRALQAHQAQAPALGRDACRLQGPDGVVLHHGQRTRGRPHARPCAAKALRDHARDGASGPQAHEHWGHSVHLFLTNPEALADFAAVAVHTLSMFAVMAVVALVVYDRLGLMILKRTWFNVDLCGRGLWSGRV